LPLPDESAATVPSLSSSFHQPTRVGSAPYDKLVRTKPSARIKGIRKHSLLRIVILLQKNVINTITMLLIHNEKSVFLDEWLAPYEQLITNLRQPLINSITIIDSPSKSVRLGNITENRAELNLISYKNQNRLWIWCQKSLDINKSTN